MNEKLLNDLIEFGLTEYEAKVYLKLVTRGPLTTSEISKLAKIPQTKVYEIIKKLSMRTIIEESSENGHKKFKSVGPEHAINKIIANREDEVNNMKSIGREILKQIEEKTIPFDGKKGIWLSEGKREFLEKSSLMIKRSKKYAYGITREFSRISDLDEEILSASKRGVKVKLLGIGEFGALNKERAKWYSSNNVEIRMIKLGVQPRICLVDNKEVCIRIDNEHNSEFMWSDNEAMTNLVKSYFEVLWQNAQKYN
ncbi:MAG: helix-turn-helix domain-containing protein [Candidatus Aenigmatarchaeota archaeon]